MSRGTRLLIATLAPALVVLAIAIPTIVLLPGFTREVQHQQTLATVRQAGLRLNALPGTDQAPREGMLAELSRATTDLADFVRPSVVHITGMQQIDGMPVPISTGSGWIYDDSGHVITNLHVVEGCDSFEVQLFDGELRTAEIVGGDPTTDIAVLSIRAENIIPATRRPTTDHVRQGELCFAFGSPFDFRFSMSSGIVSGLGRFVGMFWRSGRSIGFENFIQVDAAINPGNSGGPLTDHLGHVIGMNTAIATNDADGQFAGIGLAIPLDMIESAVDQLIETGTVRKGYLGVSVLDQDDLIARSVGVPRQFRGTGVLVVDLEDSHPATKAGLRIGDVITMYDEVPLATAGDLDEAARQDMDRRMNLKIWRFADADSSWVDLVVTRQGEGDLLGIRVLSLHDRIGDLHRARGYTRRGVLISQPQPGMPAEQAGMLAGDIVHRVNGADVHSVRQLQSTISSVPPGRTVKIEAWRYDHGAEDWALMTFSVELSQWQ
jgi:serine protease Do